MNSNNLYYILPSTQLFPFSENIEQNIQDLDALKFAKSGYEAFSKEKFEEALGIYNEAINIYNTYPFFYACRSLIHKCMDDDEAAFYDYQIAKRYDFNYHTFLEWIENKGSMEEAAELLEINDSILKDEQNAQLYINRALLQVQHFNYTEAINDYERAYSLSLNPEILISLAAIQLRVLRYSEALKNLNKAIEGNDSLVSAYVYRAKLHAAIKCQEEALADFNKAFDLSNADTTVLEERASFFESIENWEAAISDYSNIIRQSPEDFYPYVLRADLYEKRNDLQLALADYNQAIILNPYYSDLYQYRGDIKQQLGDDVGAEADFKKFEELEEEY